MPLVVLALAIWGWNRIVVWATIPHCILPSDGRVLATPIKDWPILFDALLATLQIPCMALAVAVIGGVVLAVLFTQSRWAEMSFYPFAVIVQVTLMVSVAPLIFIYIENRTMGFLLCALTVAFFSIFANTTHGLNSARTADCGRVERDRGDRGGTWGRAGHGDLSELVVRVRSMSLDGVRPLGR